MAILEKIKSQKIDPDYIRGEIERLKRTSPQPNFFLVQDDFGTCWKGVGDAYWGQSHYAECRFATLAEAEMRANQARGYGYKVEIKLVDMAAGRLARIEHLKARLIVANKKVPGEKD